MQASGARRKRKGSPSQVFPVKPAKSRAAADSAGGNLPAESNRSNSWSIRTAAEVRRRLAAAAPKMAALLPVREQEDSSSGSNASSSRGHGSGRLVSPPSRRSSDDLIV